MFEHDERLTNLSKLITKISKINLLKQFKKLIKIQIQAYLNKIYVSFTNTKLILYKYYLYTEYLQTITIKGQIVLNKEILSRTIILMEYNIPQALPLNYMEQVFCRSYFLVKNLRFNK